MNIPIAYPLPMRLLDLFVTAPITPEKVANGFAAAFTVSIIIIAVVAYLIGSVPFGLILTKLTGKGDIRAIGSGNIGATNVLRTGDKKLAALTLLLDLLKGSGATILGMMLGAGYFVAGLFVVLGHLFPIWLRFKGGKGVATAIGMFLVISLPLGLSVIVTWIVVFALSRISSLSALAAFMLAPAYAYMFLPELADHAADSYSIGFIFLIAVLVIARHHSNIRRLIKGEEPRFGLAT